MIRVAVMCSAIVSSKPRASGDDPELASDLAQGRM